MCDGAVAVMASQAKRSSEADRRNPLDRFASLAMTADSFATLV
jgi:hypothetical protein